MMVGRGHSNRTAAAAAAILCLALWPAPAAAQQWLANREGDEGPGIRLGDSLVFHPGLGIEGGYDTNFFYSEDNTPGAGRLRLAVHLDLATRPPERREDAEGEVHQGTVDFRLGLAAAYYEYFSDLADITNQRNVAIDAGLHLHILPGRVFSILLTDAFTRGIQPQNDVGPRNFNRDFNDARLTFQYSPGGGMFELQVGYGFGLNYYEDAAGDLQLLGNSTAHEVFTNLRWRFLPKTAFVFTGIYRPIFREDGTSAIGFSPHDSHNVRGLVGIAGLLTNRFSLLAQVGYGGGWYLEGGQDYDSVVARVELGFHITPTASIAVGYHRDFFDSIFSDYYSRDRAYLSYNHLIAGRVLLSLRGGFSYVAYATDPIYGERADPMADAMLFAEYRIRDWIAVNATFEYLGNFTSYESPWAEDSGAFHRFVAMAGVRAMY